MEKGHTMSGKFIYYGYVDVYDDEIFTEKRLLEWKKHLLDSYEDIFDLLREKIDYVSPVQFCISESLLEEVITDAVIGMRKIVDSKNNSVENPNTFKIASYLAYWWLRHKPVSLHYPTDFRLQDVQTVVDREKSAEQNEEERQKLIWQLKHINELTAVQIVATYIFDFDKEVCSQQICNHVKDVEGDNFNFESFGEMRDILLEKLTYYFAYRAIAPKVIEHLLEAYTFHPAWGLTGKQWALDEE